MTCEFCLSSVEEHADILEYPARPQLLTLRSNSGQLQTAILEYVPPVQTKPSSPLSVLNFQAIWKEVVVLNSGAEASAGMTPVLLFEVSTPY